MHATKRWSRCSIPFLFLALAVLGSGGPRPAHALQGAGAEGLRAELLADLDNLESKYLGLAEALSQEQYSWRPAEDVRSVSEVFMHVAGANYLFGAIVGVDVPADLPGAPDLWAMLGALEEVTDEAAVRDALRRSFAHARTTVAAIRPQDLDGTADLFGTPATRRAALLMLVTHMHEHLGQSIAYARMNGVAPPWSEG
jgi:uncharacterized damage-inducible protein DinB